MFVLSLSASIVLATTLSPTIVFAAIRSPTIVPFVIDAAPEIFPGVALTAADHGLAFPVESIALTLT